MLNLATPYQTTRLFQNGNSQAVRIPAAFAFPSTDIPMHIERIGMELRIRPVAKKLDGKKIMEVFASFPKNFMADGRGDHEQVERESL